MRYSANLNIIIKAIEKSLTRTPRDFMELENLQTSPNSANKFTNACYSHIKRVLIEDLSSFRSYFNIILADGEKIVASPNAEYSYIVFPIDGMTNLTRSNPDFTIAVALVHENEDGKEEAISVAVKKLIGGELYYCEKGFGAYLNNRRIRVSKRNDNSEDLVIAASNPQLFAKKFPNKKFSNRSYGCKTMEISYLASARLDAVLFKNQNLELIKPFFLLVKEAGGKVIEEKDYVILTT